MTQPDDTQPPTSAGGEIPAAEPAAPEPLAAPPVDTGQVDAALVDTAPVDVTPAAATAEHEDGAAVDAAEHVDGVLVQAQADGQDGPAAGADPDADAVDAELVPLAQPPAITFSTTTHAPAFDYTDAGVPTLGYLQDKIDRRYATALGATELAGQDERAKSAAKKVEDREQAAADKLAEIRRSLHPEG